MPTTKLKPNCFYHLFNRGVNRGAIFFNEGNYYFFLRRVRHYFKPERVDVIAYCLMPTHYHFLIQVKSGDFSQRVMQPLGTSYVKAINKQQGRIGPLFQGPYKAKVVDNGRYLAALTRYIHLNPVKAGYVEKPRQWAFSSYQEYVGIRNGTLPNPYIILNQFQLRSNYQDYVESSGSYPNEFQRWLDDPNL